MLKYLITGSIACLPLSCSNPEPSSIGANEVIGLHCQEDEVIGFDSTQPAPYPLACIHIDNL